MTWDLPHPSRSANRLFSLSTLWNQPLFRMSDTITRMTVAIAASMLNKGIKLPLGAGQAWVQMDRPGDSQIRPLDPRAD